MRDAYHDRLQHLLGELSDMCDRAGTAVQRATAAALATDIRRADQVIAAEAEMDRCRARIAREAQVLLALQAPVATDLRTLLTIVYAAENVERMGDLAHHVAKAARRRHPDPVVPPVLRARFEQMGKLAFRLACTAGAVLRGRDLLLVSGLREAELEIDDLHESLFTIVERPEWTYGVAAAVEAVLLSRYYERFADHAVAVARRTAFLITGTLGDPVEYAVR